MKILFFDPSAKSGYTMNTVRGYAMGASEASLMRVAAALAKEPGYEVAVFQVADQARRETVVEGVLHVNNESHLDPTIIVHQRTSCFVEGLAAEYPKARHIIWHHDLGHTGWIDQEEENGARGLDVVCVSDFHVNNMSKHLTGAKLHRIYNPVELDGAERKPKIAGRLGFFSSPQKGLTQVVDAFHELKKSKPWLELVVANPGYLPDIRPDGVTFLGQLPHAKCLEEMSRCEMLFYPQTMFPETMGVVLAEANAMGVPVISHDHGAAMEVLMGANAEYNSVIQATDLSIVAHAVIASSGDGPAPRADPRFYIENVLADWKLLLGRK